MDTYSVLTREGYIVCRSRLAEVAFSYLTDDTILYVNGEPAESTVYILAG